MVDRTHVVDDTDVVDADGALAPPAAAGSLAAERGMPRGTRSLCLSFSSALLEHEYQRWYAIKFQHELRMGLLLSLFLYFNMSIAFTAWSNAHTSATPSSAYRHLQLVSETLMVVTLTFAFACSLSGCTAQRPQLFASSVLLLTIGFVVLRSTLLDFAAVFTPPVLLVVIVCLSLGSTLLRMPFQATAAVGLITTAIYGVAAIVDISLAPTGAGWYPVALLFVVVSNSLAARLLERTQRDLFLRERSTEEGSTRPRLSDVSTGGAISGTISGTISLGADECAHVARAAQVAQVSDLPSFSPIVATPTRGTPTRGVTHASSDGALNRLETGAAGEMRGSGCAADEISRVAAELSGDRGGGGIASSTLDTIGVALRGSVAEVADAWRGATSGANSVEAVQRALDATGNASLREFFQKSLVRAIQSALPIVGGDGAVSGAAGRVVGGALTEPLRPTAPRASAHFSLVSASELPPWHTPYPFVLTSYRYGFSQRETWLSLFRLHNETLNVWSELLPAVLFSFWMVYFLEAHADANAADRYLVCVALACAVVARPLSSALAHLLHSVSAGGYIFWWSVDYISICAAILATSLVSGRFAFYCAEPLQLLFYVSSAGLLSTSLIAVLAVSSPSLRAASFVLFVAFCNGVPFSYQLLAKWGAGGLARDDVPGAYLGYWGASLGTFGLGLCIKSSNLPERATRAPWNDLFLASHQLWHLSINCAFALGTFLAWDVYLDWRRENGCLVV